jgi:hypothetical protein
VDPPARPGVLQIVEQNLPGVPPEPEEEAERRGLPDLVLHDSAAWCVLIESKVQAGLTEDQLQRHRRTLRRRGFESITTLVLTKSAAEQPDAISRTWSRCMNGWERAHTAPATGHLGSARTSGPRNFALPVKPT